MKKSKRRPSSIIPMRQLNRRSKFRTPAVIGVIALAAFALAFFWPSNVATSAGQLTFTSGFECKVSSITDGDTLKCVDGTRVRLHAVAAREKNETCSPGHPCPTASAAAATAKLTELASDQTLRCEQVGTSYNRVTAICQNEANVQINCAMVASGTAVIWPRYNEKRHIC